MGQASWPKSSHKGIGVYTPHTIGGVIIDCDDPNFELVCKLSKALRNELAKTSKLKKLKTHF